MALFTNPLPVYNASNLRRRGRMEHTLRLLAAVAITAGLPAYAQSTFATVTGVVSVRPRAARYRLNRAW